MAVILGSPGIFLGGASAPPVTPFTNTYSMSLDGVDEYFTAGNPSSLQITGALTLSAWVKISTGQSQQCIISKDNGSSQRSFTLWAYTSFLSSPIAYIFSGASNYSVQATTNIRDGFWHHVMLVYTPSTSLNIYVDGVLEGSNTTSIPASINNVTQAFQIGRFGTGIFQVLGNIDEVAVWNSDQSSNVSTIYNGGAPADLTSLSPVSWWRMGDGDIFRENLIIYSEDLTQTAWTKTGSTISADSIVAPDGLTTADKIVEDISSGSHFVQKTSITIIISETYNLSVYLKAGERNIVRVASAVDSSVPYANVDLSSGSILFSTYANTPNLISVGNDWYRFDVTIVANNAITPPITVFLYNGSSFTYTGDNVSGVYVWGAQLTNSSSVLDYVQTSSLAIKKWTLTDNGSGGNDATSVNMEEADRVTDVP